MRIESHRTNNHISTFSQLQSANSFSFSTSSICSLAETVFLSPIRAIWVWIRKICCCSSPNNELISLKRYVLEHFPSKPKPNPKFDEEFQEKFKKLPKSIQDKMTEISINAFREIVDASHFSGFSPSDIRRFGEDFIARPSNPFSADVKMFLMKGKKYEEGAKDLLAKILDKTIEAPSK